MRTVYDKALHIQKTLGTRAAAGYLRNQGYPIECALWALAYNRVNPRVLGECN